MKSALVRLALLAALVTAFAAVVEASRAEAQEVFRFADVTLADGNTAHEHAQIQVRVKASTGAGYTRADYFDQQGHRLGFYEVFEVVSHEEAVLRRWAIRNFPDRTASAR